MGDHPAVEPIDTGDLAGGAEEDRCQVCNKLRSSHGHIPSPGKGRLGYIVCPGDWIITGTAGEHYPCKPDIFPDIYEEVFE
jgi:hypothetical protein